MEEYVCITVLSRPGESEAEFSFRLSQLWTGMLRDHKEEFEKVYAETAAFEQQGSRLSRQYLAQLDVISLLEDVLNTANVDCEPIDRDEIYSRYEATSPEWMQIEH